MLRLHMCGADTLFYRVVGRNQYWIAGPGLPYGFQGSAEAGVEEIGIDLHVLS